MIWNILEVYQFTTKKRWEIYLWPQPPRTSLECSHPCKTHRNLGPPKGPDSGRLSWKVMKKGSCCKLLRSTRLTAQNKASQEYTADLISGIVQETHLCVLLHVLVWFQTQHLMVHRWMLQGSNIVFHEHIHMFWDLPIRVETLSHPGTLQPTDYFLITFRHVLHQTLQLSSVYLAAPPLTPKVAWFAKAEMTNLSSTLPRHQEQHLAYLSIMQIKNEWCLAWLWAMQNV